MTRTTRTTRWTFINVGDVIVWEGEAVTVTATVYAAPWRDITLSNGTALSVKGSWKVEIVNA